MLTHSKGLIFFVTGSDNAEVRRKAQELAIELAPGEDAFGMEVIEAPGETVEHSVNAIKETIQSLQTFPFLGEGKLVWLKGATFLKDSPAGRSEATQEALEKLLKVLKSELPEGTRFLMSAPEPDKRRSFYKSFSALAAMTICDKPDFGFNATEHDVIAWVTTRARERGVRLDPEAAEVLAARVGAHSGQMESELAKLITAAGEGAIIHEKMVRDLVPQTRTGGIFDLSNAIAKHDLPLSISTLKQLLHQGESAIGILLAAIVPTVRNLLLAKSLLTTHRLKAPEKPQFFTSALQKLPASETAHLPRKKDGSLNAYGLGISAVNASKFEELQLAKGFLACRDTNQQLLRTQGGEEMLLTQLVVRLVAPNLH
ncbi:MAG: DNA polymerase III subunit delta [Verrucomicrobia bacterium]|nr:DNA polymerase III subunit delta [Verrucomicrobiota bacterium]